MRITLVALLVAAMPTPLLFGCTTAARPSELVALEKLRADPNLSDPDRRAYDLLAAADDLMVRAEAEWDRRDLYAARRDAIMGGIKMRTALAILQAQQAAGRIKELDAELAIAREEDQRLVDQLATAREELLLIEQLHAMKSAAATERTALSARIDSANKQAATDRQRLAEQLAAEKRRAEAFDGIHRAELAIRSAETVDTARYAKAKYAAAVSMLQEAHKEFDGGHWDETLARTALAQSEAEEGITAARPLYEKAEAVMSNRLRDRALEVDATGIPGVTTRLERAGDVQRLVLTLGGLFADGKAVLLPEGAKTLDGIKDLLATYPTYSVQVTGFTDDQGKADSLVSLSLARANAVYWVLVARGIDPKRISVDGKGAADPIADNATPAGRARNSRTELGVLYHIGE